MRSVRRPVSGRLCPLTCKHPYEHLRERLMVKHLVRSVCLRLLTVSYRAPYGLSVRFLLINLVRFYAVLTVLSIIRNSFNFYCVVYIITPLKSHCCWLPACFGLASNWWEMRGHTRPTSRPVGMRGTSYPYPTHMHAASFALPMSRIAHLPECCMHE